MTDLLLILDASGSMTGQYNTTVASFQRFINGAREDRSAERVYTVAFNHNYPDTEANIVRIHDGVHISEIKPLNRETYRPRGGTPLLDAVGQTLQNMIGGRMFVVIITDGHENKSSEYTIEAVKALIREREEQGWDFVFLGADIDAWNRDSRGMGFSAGKTLSFNTAFMANAMDRTRGALQQYTTTGERLPDDYFLRGENREEFQEYFDPDNNRDDAD